MIKPDPVAHIRESNVSWVQNADEATTRAILRIRRYLDSNLKKPSIPANWKPLRTVAQDLHLNPGHLARLCREEYSALDLAKLCTHRGRQTWCLSPDVIATLPNHRATDAPHDAHRLRGPSPEITAPSSRQEETSCGSELREGGAK